MDPFDFRSVSPGPMTVAWRTAQPAFLAPGHTFACTGDTHARPHLTPRSSLPFIPNSNHSHHPPAHHCSTIRSESLSRPPQGGLTAYMFAKHRGHAAVAARLAKAGARV